MKPEQVPEEVWRALGKELGFIQHRDAYCTAIAAALSAWPGMSQLAENDSASIREMAALILPLPQENPDDKA